MQDVRTLTTGDGLIPKVLDRTAGEKGGQDECKEPSGDSDAYDNATNGKLAKGEDAVVEDENGKLHGSAGNREDASGGEENLDPAISIPMSRCKWYLCEPSGTLIKDVT